MSLNYNKYSSALPIATAAPGPSLLKQVAGAGSAAVVSLREPRIIS